MLRSTAILLGFGAAFFAATPVYAGPEARVRVRGSSRLSATASATANGFLVQGALLEDAGRPVSGARLKVSLISRDGSPRMLARPEPCNPLPDKPQEPYREREQVIAVTDAAGRFCLRWSNDFPDGVLKLEFEDERQLLDAAEESVEIEPGIPLELEFAPAPRTLSLDSPELVVTLASRAHAQGSADSLPLELLWTRVGAPTTSLLKRPMRPGETVQLRFPSAALGAPGPGELRARLGTGERAAQAFTQTMATATVSLELPERLTLHSSGDGVVNVTVLAAAGAVSSGSVEALMGERTVGIAPVSAGRAELGLTMGPGPLSVPVRVRYLPASPWWVAGPPREVEVTVARTSAWRGFVWAVALAAIATWLVAAWRRPPRRERPAEQPPTPTRPLEASVRWVSGGDIQRGWAGTVCDAHDGAPLAGVRISVEFIDGRSARTVTEPDGSFRLEPLDATSGAHAVGRLHAEGPWHSPLDWPLPPPGRVAVTLITRRRTLLTRLVEWARGRGAPWSSSVDPTPGELIRTAEGLGQGEVAEWARAVESSAFGPRAVDLDEESRVRALEPDAKP